MKKLKATNARDAQRELLSIYRLGGLLRGYNKDGECCYIATVRPKGIKHYTTTAHKGSHIPVRFETH